MGPSPAVAAVRLAVRRALADLDPGDRILVACSGGADSLALASATAFEAPKRGLLAGAITVDHGLQDGSAVRAKTIVDVLRGMGFIPSEAAKVEVSGDGGPEAAARNARYRALDQAAARANAKVVLLGHTRDDQAETVLLGLTRGSGARSLAGMARVSGLYRRPLLDLERSTLRQACADQELTVWDDPHNSDPAFTRVRVRDRVLPLLEDELGPGIAAALARTADQLRADNDLLDAWSDRAYVDCRRLPREGTGAPAASREGGDPTSREVAQILAIDDLAALPTAIRRRVLRRTALDAGCPPASLFSVHIEGMDALITHWRGQTHVDLPGGIRARRVGAGLGAGLALDADLGPSGSRGA